MNVQDLSKSFQVHRLSEGDVEQIYQLSCGNLLFYHYNPPFVTKESIRKDMKALPAGKTEKDKYYLGFFKQDTLVAIMDLILDYPVEKIAWIGLLMVDQKFQHQNTGSRIVQELMAMLKSAGFESIRLGVNHGNPQSSAFWMKNQFEIIDEGKCIIMEFTLIDR